MDAGIYILLSCFGAVRAGCLSSYYTYHPELTAPSNARQQAVDLLTSLLTGAPNTSVNSINDHKYIQHNVGVADGKAEIVKFVNFAAANPVPASKWVRVFQDDDLVFVHSEAGGPNPRVGWDVFRFEDDQIVEHWDNFRDEPSKSNGAGHTMVDGPTQSRDPDKTFANKALVKSFVNEVLVNGKAELGPGYFATPYIQHTPSAFADGYQATAALIKLLPAGTTLCSRIRHLMGEGDMVLVLCDGTIGTNASAFYDLYRVENGKIAEHWDVIAPIPPITEWKSFNGKF